MAPDSPQAFDGKAFVRTLSTSPGVYRYFDADGELLYVGKAGNLKKRVGSYFLKPRLEPRIAAMIAQIARCEITVTRTEGEALPAGVPFLRHIGIYAYRAGFLAQYARLARTPLEQAESLEQLRVLEHGHAIAVRLTPEPFPPGIDTEADLVRAGQWLQAQR